MAQLERYLDEVLKERATADRPGARDRQARNGASFLLLVAGFISLGPTVALAHAYLDHADPAPGSTLAQAPAQLRLTFSEDVDPSFLQVHVLNAQHAAVDRGDSHNASDDPRALMVSLRDGLPDGVYTVAWRTLSATTVTR